MADMKITAGKKESRTVIDSIFWKIVITNILNTTAWVTIADAAVIGNFLGVKAVGAYGMVWPVVFFFGLIAGVIGGGTRNLYAGLVGQGKTEEANRVFTLSFIGTFVLSIIIIIGTLTCSEHIAVFLGVYGNNEELKPLVAQYLRGFVWEVPFFSLGALMSPLMVIDSDFKRPAYARMAMTVVDISADLAVVLFFNKSMFLIGFTTGIAQMVYFLVLLSHFRQKEHLLRFDFSRILIPFRMIKDVLVNGSANVTSNCSNTFGGLIVNHFFSLYLGSIYLSAYSVHRSVTSILGVFYFGIADAVWTLSRLYYGEEDRQALDKVQRKTMKMGIALAVSIAVITIICAPLLTRIFIAVDHAEAFSLSEQAVRVFAYSLPLYVLVYSFKNYLLGTDHILASNVYVFLVEFCSLICSVWIMIHLAGGRGAWFATPVRLLLVLAGTVIYILMCGTGKSFNEKRLMLKEDFGVKPEDELSRTVYDREGLAEMSVLAQEFCASHNIESKKTAAISRCIIELGGSMIDHGFKNGRKHSMDIRLVNHRPDLLLRLRDDCDSFDPADQCGDGTWLNDLSDIQYLRTVSTNNLIIKLSC